MARTVTKDGPDPIDVHVGRRLRQRRTLLGFSQQKLAGEINLTFQQLQKYERGSNRVSASCLFRLARGLDVPVSFFFEEIGSAMLKGVMPSPADIASTNAALNAENDTLCKRETLELVRSYYKIGDPKVRKRLFEMTKTLGKSAIAA